MLLKAQKWGNSLAVRIPKPLAVDVGIKADDCLDARIIDGTIVLTPEKGSRYQLIDLLTGITDANLHGPIDFGEPVGKELL